MSREEIKLIKSTNTYFRFPSFSEQYISTLDVTMDNQILVQVFEALKCVAQDRLDDLFRDGPF